MLPKSAGSALKSHWHTHTVCDTHTVCVIADTTFLPTSYDRIVLKKLAEEVASFKCALTYTTRLEQPLVWLFLVNCVDCVTVTI